MRGFVLDLGRAQRRALVASHFSPVTDLMISRLPGVIWLGIRHKGAVRLSDAQARRLAEELLGLLDPPEEE